MVGPVVVLDSTELVSDPNLRGAVIRSLLEATRRRKCDVFVPEVVIIEAVAHHDRELKKLMRSIQSTVKDIRRKSVSEVDFSFAVVALEGECDTYESWLRHEFVEAGAVIIPLPTTPHTPLVQAAAAREQPFQEDGSGYRDALIWESAKEVAARQLVPRLAFVTRNYKDFADPQNPGVMSGHLLRQLRAATNNDAEVQLVSDLKSFVTEKFKASLDAIGEIERRLQDSDFNVELLRSMAETVPEFDDDFIAEAYDVRLWDLEAEIVVDPSDMRVDDANDVDANHIALSTHLDLDVSFWAVADGLDYFATDRSGRPPIIESLDQGVLLVGDDFTIASHPVTAIIDRQTGTVVTLSI